MTPPTLDLPRDFLRRRNVLALVIFKQSLLLIDDELHLANLHFRYVSFGCVQQFFLGFCSMYHQVRQSINEDEPTGYVDLDSHHETLTLSEGAAEYRSGTNDTARSDHPSTFS